LFGVGEEAAAAGELALAGGFTGGVVIDVAAPDVALLLAAVVVGGVDDAATPGVVDVAASVDEAIVSTGDVDAEVDSVEVAATCARAGLTMTNPITSVTRTAKIPRNEMTLVFIALVLTNNANNI
jgi:hypothetical protein